MVDVDVRVPSHLKEKLTWAVDKWLRIISTIMLFKNSNSTKKLKGTKYKAVLNFKKYCISCYVALSDVFSLFRDSFYCEVSSLTNRAYLRYVSV